MLDECGRPVHPPIDIEKIQPSPRALRLRKGSTLGILPVSRIYMRRVHQTCSLASETLRFFSPRTLFSPLLRSRKTARIARARDVIDLHSSACPSRGHVVPSSEKKSSPICQRAFHAPGDADVTSRLSRMFQSTEGRCTREEVTFLPPSSRAYTRTCEPTPILPLYLRVESLRQVTAGENA